MSLLLVAASLLSNVQIVCYPHAEVENAYACVYTEIDSGETYMQVCDAGHCSKLVRITQRPKPAKKTQV